MKKAFLSAMVLVSPLFFNSALANDARIVEIVQIAHNSDRFTEGESQMWPELLARPLTDNEIQAVIRAIAAADDLYSEKNAGQMALANALGYGVIRANHPQAVAKQILKYDRSPAITQMIGMLEWSASDVQRENLMQVLDMVASQTLNLKLRALIRDQQEAIVVNYYGGEIE